MADTYEQNLGQKSSLTTSDYIRVVGSDNVSYKQPLGDVLYAGGVRYKEFATGTAFSDFADSCNIGITFSYNRYPTQSSDAPSTLASERCAVVVYRTSSDEIVISAVVFNNASEPTTYVRRRFGSWGNWVKQPTRAEIDALNSKTTGTIVKYSGISGGTLDFMGLSRIGNTVFASARLYNVSSTANGNVFEVPSGFRPAQDTRVMGYIYVNNVSVPVPLMVHTNGYISLSYSSSQTLTQVGFAGSWSAL